MVAEYAFQPPLPGRRTFTARRKVRLGDVGLDGRLRLDALARYLQDVANDDTADAGIPDDPWVLRRARLAVQGRPHWNDTVEVTTWSAGLGSRWAERRTTVTSDRGLIESSAIWVHVDDRGRPARITGPVAGLYARPEVPAPKARLVLPDPPVDADPADPGDAPDLDQAAARLPGEEWPVRCTDYDAWGHVNNSVHWAMVEEEPLDHAGFEMEYRRPIEPGMQVRHLQVPASGLHWLVGPAGVHAAARVSPLGGAAGPATL